MRQLTMLAGATFLTLSTQAFAEGDAVKGERVFKKCAACHAVGEGAKNKVGPQLNGIIDAAWGQVEGYKYSKALLDLSEGKIWDAETLSAYLEKPRNVIPKGRMAFAGLRKEADRDNVIAYLAQFNADGTKK